MQNPTNASDSIFQNPLDALWALSWCGRATLLLLLIGWCVWFAPFDDLLDRSGTPLGGDYVMLYVAGETVLAGEAGQLYDDRANQAKTAAHFPTMDPTESWPYRYPPLTAWLMSWLARFDYAFSFLVFTLVSAVAVVWACVTLTRALKIETGSRQLVLWSLLGWPLVGEALLGGQTSPLALLCVTLAAVALDRDRDYLAGCLLGLCIYKPNIVGLLIVGTLVARPKAFWGMLAVACIALGLSWYTAGSSGLQQYAGLSMSLATSSWQLETPFWKVQGLAPLLDHVWVGRGKALAFLLGLPVACFIGWKWRQAPNAQARWLCFASLLLINALLNPYVPIYDLLLIVPSAAIVIHYFVSKHRTRLTAALPGLITVVAIFFAGPHISQALAKVLGFQLFPIALLAILALVIRELSPARGTSHAERGLGCGQ